MNRILPGSEETAVGNAYGSWLWLSYFSRVHELHNAPNTQHVMIGFRTAQHFSRTS